MSEPSEGRKVSRVGILAATLVGGVVTVGVILSVLTAFGPGQPAPSQAASQAASAPAPATTSQDSTGSVCGLGDVKLTGTVSTAPSAKWELVGTTAAPEVKGQGPGQIDEDGFRSCYAQTPTGAVVASANYVAIGSDATLRARLYRDATVPGPGRDALMARPITGGGSGGVRIQIAGFRVLRYSGDRADVDIAIRTSTGAVGAAVLHLQWSGGDWKMQVADDGSELSPAVQLPSLSGYTLWSGA